MYNSAMTNKQYSAAVGPNCVGADSAAHRAALAAAAVRVDGPWTQYAQLGRPGRLTQPARSVTISFPGVTERKESWSEGLDLVPRDSGRLAWLRRARPDLLTDAQPGAFRA